MSFRTDVRNLLRYLLLVGTKISQSLRSFEKTLLFAGWVLNQTGNKVAYIAC